MGNKLYVGNLPYSVRDEDLQQAFSAYGAETEHRLHQDGLRTALKPPLALRTITPAVRPSRHEPRCTLPDL